MNNIIQTITKRKSTRTFTTNPINNETKILIKEYIEKLTNPWGVKIKYTLIENHATNTTEKLGTYGVIRNAANFITAALTDVDFGLEALGYEMEELILYLSDMEIGSCWLGGTFNRSQFTNEINLQEGEIIPIIVPIGYIAKKKTLTDNFMRKMSKGDFRKNWNEMFFNESFDKILTFEEAGSYGQVLEMVRLAPSASNKQPWRIVKEGNNYHFYEYKTPGYSKIFSYDIQRIDIGISAAHFSLTAKELGFSGIFLEQEPNIEIPDNMIYKFTWRGNIK